MEQWEEGGKADMLVSDAQVLSALGLALMIVTTAEAAGCSNDSSWTYYALSRIGVCLDQMFATFSVTFVVIGNCIEETNCLQRWKLMTLSHWGLSFYVKVTSY